jgi:hypothetical protein
VCVCVCVCACACLCRRACVPACVEMENVACNYKPIVTILSRLVVKCNVLLSIKELVCVVYKIVQRRAPPQLNMQSKLNSALTFVDLQLDAQNSCLFTYNTFIKILYMFRALPCSSSGGLSRNCTYAASGIVTLCR